MAYNYFEGRRQVLMEEHHQRLRHQITLRGHLRDRIDPFLISSTEFIRLYRMPQHQVMEIVELVRPYTRERQGTAYVPLEVKVLATISFFAVGSYQRGVGRSADLNLSQTMMSRSIHEVTAALNHPDVLKTHIHFPLTHEERVTTVARNLTALGMPGTIGFIDGTLVKIATPRLPEKQVYRSRKGYPAVNVQIVCDADLYIQNVNARFPGSSTDPYIYRSSRVRDVMRNAFEEDRCWLLGDSAYPHEPWLMTPLPHAAPGSPEYYYTKLHCHCRNAIERCIGLLKARWRCLLTDRTLHYDPVFVGLIVNACVVLHNILTVLRVPQPQPIFENLGPDDPDEPGEDAMAVLRLANDVRRHLIDYAVAQRRRLHAED